MHSTTVKATRIKGGFCRFFSHFSCFFFLFYFVCVCSKSVFIAACRMGSLLKHLSLAVVPLHSPGDQSKERGHGPHNETTELFPQSSTTPEICTFSKNNFFFFKIRYKEKETVNEAGTLLLQLGGTAPGSLQRPAGYEQVTPSSDCTPEALLPTAPWGSRHGWSPWQQDLKMSCRKPAQRGCSEACSQQALQGFPAPRHHLRAQDPLSRNLAEGLGKGPLVQSGPLPHL